ncbi:MAG: BatD family protein [Candidatus Omnitrophota bacterium]|nr:BatD family protein [Candidatus Omnitrophota bacterium]
MKNKLIWWVILFILSYATVASADTSLKAEVDRLSLTTDEILTYKLIITSSDKKISAPQLPKFEGFSVVSSAHSSTVSFVKNNIKTILVYAYILAPTDIGKFKIEPSTIKIKNETYSTDTFGIEVKFAKVRSQAKPEQKPPVPKGTHPEKREEPPQITL